MKRVLVVLAVNPDYIQFALPELKSILRKTNIPLKTLFKREIQQKDFPQHQYQITYKLFKKYPFIQLQIPDFQTHREYFCRAAKHSVMVSKFILLISEGKTYLELYQNKNQQILQKQCRDWDDQVFCDFSSRNRSIKRNQQIPKITEVLKILDIRGKVNINQPNKIFSLIQDHIWYIKHHEQASEKTLQYIYFGLELSNFRNLKGLKFNIQYQLPNRIYLGPTSTDNDLAFLMCHQANVYQNSFVLDPFVGTGSLLIPPAYYKAFTFGSDLDIRVINGYAVGKINKRSKHYSKQKQLQFYTPKIMLNFQQYKLQKPEIYRMDCLTSKFRQQQFFDAIICDPPYGLRAMSRTVNQKQHHQQQKQYQQQQKQIEDLETVQNQQFIKDEQQNQQQQQALEEVTIKQVQELTLEQKQKKRLKKQMRKQNRKKRKENITTQEKEIKQKILKKFMSERSKHPKKQDRPKIQTTQKKQIYTGLLNFASKYLKKSGFLVFLFPIMVQQQYKGTAEQLPTHQNFELIDFSVNRLAKGNIRILITMKKKK